MNIDDKRKLLDSFGGKYFTASFVKVNGELRTGTFKKWEKRFLHGQPGENANPVAHKPEYFTVAEQSVQGYRNINLMTLKHVKCGSVDIQF